MKTTWRRVIITDSSIIASSFKTYFAEVAPSHNPYIPRLLDDPVININAISNSFDFRITDAEEVYKTILSLNSRELYSGFIIYK